MAFADAVIDGRHNDFRLNRSHRPWTPWFCDIAWGWDLAPHRHRGTRRMDECRDSPADDPRRLRRSAGRETKRRGWRALGAQVDFANVGAVPVGLRHRGVVGQPERALVGDDHWQW